MTPEGRIKAKVKKVLDALGASWHMPVSTGFGKAGIADFVGCLQGKYFEIECKANGNKPTALQLAHAAEVRRAGGVWLLIDDTNVHCTQQELLTCLTQNVSAMD